MGEAVAQKVCVVCKTDCGGRPRIKDERNRYVCRECLNTTGSATVDQALNAAQASAAAYDDGIDIRSAVSAEAHAPIADLGEDKSCPKCSGFMAAEQRICMRCGYDRKQKRGYRTRIEKVKEVKARRATPLIDPSIPVLLLGLPVVGAGVMTFVDPPTWGLWFVLGWLGYTVLTVIAILVAQVIDRAWGYLMLTGLYVGMMGLTFYTAITGDASTAAGVGLGADVVGFLSAIATLYWVFSENERDYLKVAWIVCFICRIMIIAISMMLGAMALSGNAPSP